MKKISTNQMFAHVTQLFSRFPVLLLLAGIAAVVSAFAAYDRVTLAVTNNIILTDIKNFRRAVL